MERTEQINVVKNRDKRYDGKFYVAVKSTDEKAVERWRNAMGHRMSQKEGREKLFESYQYFVMEV